MALDFEDFEDDEDGHRATGVLSPDGMQVCEDQCSTCIFLPGNKMHLNPGRLANMVADVKRDDGFVTCHQTLDWPIGAICRGSFDRYETTPVQLAKRLGFIRWVNPRHPTEPDRTQEQQ